MDYWKMPAFGAMLQTMRSRKHMSQQELASALGVHRNTIGNWERGGGLPQSKGLVLELASQLQLDNTETRQLLEASHSRLAPYWTVPFPRNPCFTGREAILNELYGRLGPEFAMALTKPLAMYGLGGIGKTQLAVEYAYRYALEYSAVFWIGAETADHVVAGLLRIAEEVQLPERQEADQQRVVAAVQRWLSAHKSWLLIADNLEDWELLSRYLPSTRQGAVLITTRRQAFGLLAQGIELQILEPEEGILLLLRRAKLLGPEATHVHLCQFAMRRPTQYATARELVTLLGGLPLALDQAGAYIEETGCSLDDYVHYYEQHRLRLLDCRGIQAGDHPQSVATTFLIAYRLVEQDCPLATDLLRLCAFLHADAIPEELLLVVGIPLEEMPSASAIDASQLDLALATLRTFSLVQQHPEKRTFSIHRLVQAVLRDRMSVQEQRVWLRRGITALNAVFPEVTSEAWGRCEHLLPHVLACTGVLPPQLEDRNVAQLLRKTADYLRERAKHKQAESLLQWMFSSVENRFFHLDHSP